jgi:hypothetical protein
MSETESSGGGASGPICFIFGLISVFFLSPLFVPLALLAGFFALFNGQWGWLFFGMLLAIVGTLSSPTLLGFLTVMGISLI